MIPKIIHLCWLSGDPYPVEIQKCLDSWKKYLPDYEVWVWDTKRFDINSAIWTKQAFEAKKYALLQIIYVSMLCTTMEEYISILMCWYIRVLSLY